MRDCTALFPAEQAATTTLVELAERINAEHREAEAAMNTGLQHALEAGRLLLQAKTEVSHGQWSLWLKANFEGSTRTARAYALVAQRWPQLEEANWQHAANLTIRQVLKICNDAPKHKSPLSLDEIFNSAQVYTEDLRRREGAFYKHGVRAVKRRLAACETVQDCLAAERCPPEPKAVIRERHRLERERLRLDRWCRAVGKSVRNRLSELARVTDGPAAGPEGDGR
jgi:hypothetical protein